MVPLDDAVDDEDEGARGPADLGVALVQDGDDEAADDGGMEALLGNRRQNKRGILPTHDTLCIVTLL